jgi:hypothetical protein
MNIHALGSTTVLEVKRQIAEQQGCSVEAIK